MHARENKNGKKTQGENEQRMNGSWRRTKKKICAGCTRDNHCSQFIHLNARQLTLHANRAKDEQKRNIRTTTSATMIFFVHFS